MFAGMIAGYGLGVIHFLKYLVPLKHGRRYRDFFAGTLHDLPVGSSKVISSGSGGAINLVRLHDAPDDPASGFKAMSTKCPHLGCRVHWQSGKERFYCPCHDGVFNKEGIAVSGPPASEKKDLPTFDVTVDPQNAWVFVRVPEETRNG
jgi:nitrite reductase/ring-hydroxylating ferredoxin subunit